MQLGLLGRYCGGARVGVLCRAGILGGILPGARAWMKAGSDGGMGARI